MAISCEFLAGFLLSFRHEEQPAWMLSFCKYQIDAMVSGIWGNIQPEAIHEYHAHHIRPEAYQRSAR